MQGVVSIFQEPTEKIFNRNLNLEVPTDIFYIYSYKQLH